MPSVLPHYPVTLIFIPLANTPTVSFLPTQNQSVIMRTNTLSKLSALRATVASGCEILHDLRDPRFHERLRRWTNIDRQISHCYYPPSVGGGLPQNSKNQSITIRILVGADSEDRFNGCFSCLSRSSLHVAAIVRGPRSARRGL